MDYGIVRDGGGGNCNLPEALLYMVMMIPSFRKEPCTAGIKLGYCDEHSAGLLEMPCEARDGAVGGVHPSRHYFSIRS